MEMEKNLNVTLKNAIMEDLMPQPAVERDWNKVYIINITTLFYPI